MFKQMSKYCEPFFSKIQCSFRKGFSTQHYILLMFEKWKLAFHNQKRFGALLTDLSKAFDRLSHDLLVATLNAYGFNIDSVILVQDYLTYCILRTAINSVYSSWEEILLRVP